MSPEPRFPTAARIQGRQLDFTELPSPGQHFIVVTGCAVRTGRIEEKDPAGPQLSEVATVIVVGILLEQPFQHLNEAGKPGRDCLGISRIWRAARSLGTLSLPAVSLSNPSNGCRRQIAKRR